MSPLIDFSQKDATGNPKIITGKEVVEVVPTPADQTLPIYPDEKIAADQEPVPSPSIDCSNIPKGTWGLDKIHAWFDENGIGYGDVDTKDELIADAKQLCVEQES